MVADSFFPVNKMSLIIPMEPFGLGETSDRFKGTGSRVKQNNNDKTGGVGQASACPRKKKK